mgnify:CR=1 FL=1
MGYEEQGIPMDRGFVTPDERLHTGVGNIYAIGDIVPGVQLAHRGFDGLDVVAALDQLHGVLDFGGEVAVGA